ncbi:MAG: MFS transporter [Byssovorax sp.]
MGYLELLRTQRKFRRLWLGQVVSELGDWLQMIALLLLFPTKGASAMLLSGVFIVRMLPSIVWAPLAGVLADRYPRGRVMVACDLGRALIVLGYLLVRGPEDVIWIYLLMFAQESLTTFFEPARAAALPQVVEPRALLAANSLAGATWSAMLAIGATLGGLIASFGGPRAAFLADAASFLLSALLIGSIGVPRVKRDAASEAAHAADRFGLYALREGARYLRGHAAQASAAMVKGLWGLCGGIVFLFSIYAGEIFATQGADPARSTGLLYAGRGLGALIGPLIARRIWGESARGLRLSILAGFPLSALGYLALSTCPSAAFGAGCLVLAHSGGSTCWVSSTQLIQMTVPNDLQGRVFAVEQAAFTLTVAMSNALVGAAIGEAILGARGATVAMACAAAVAAGIWGMAMRRLGPRLDAAAAAASRAS